MAAVGLAAGRGLGLPLSEGTDELRRPAFPNRADDAACVHVRDWPRLRLFGKGSLLRLLFILTRTNFYFF